MCIKQHKGYHTQVFTGVGFLTIELEEYVRRVLEYQKNPHVHPLTCENDSSHELLIPGFKGTNVILYCPTCGYVQDWIPEIVTSSVWCHD